MSDNRNGQTIFLSVIGIATLLVAIIGATFAYFTTQMSGTAGNSEITTAKLGSVRYTAEGIENGKKILPGWTSDVTEGEGDDAEIVKKKVEITLTASEVAFDYACYLDITENSAQKDAEGNTVDGKTAITDMYLSVEGDGAKITGERQILPSEVNDSSEDATDAAKKAGRILITSGTLAASTTDQTAIAYYTLTFKDIGNQNAQQGATFKATVSCEAKTGANETLYYNASNPNGTPVEP